LSRQTTIKRPATVEGAGLFDGRPCRLRVLPAEADAGIAFVRTVAGGKEVRIPCSVENLLRRERRTALTNGEAAVATVEHVLSALVGLGIDNALVEVDAEEVPSIDGSPLPFVEAVAEAGLRELDAPREVYTIEEPLVVTRGEGSIAALPAPGEGLEILYELDYPQTPAIGRQVFAFSLGRGDYAAQVAPARTFLLEEEADLLRSQGLGAHLTPKDLCVIGADGPIDNELRFVDEPVRHKVADLIGDLALVGRPLSGRIVATHSGHELNHALARRLREAIDEQEAGRKLVSQEVAMDIRKVMRILPHRYPFLMIDRVLEMEGGRRAVAIKNITINEPYFQGHYPGQPVMPGVLILEAMAQLSGLLLSQELERTGKVGILLSMDRVKMRRPVRPGDQLILESEAIRVRARTGHCRCRARIGKDVAAEAEIKFMIVDPEPV
jgi:UDP-3-O-[3-hydroxymyristoyl] N-acetylglucosamine deacetylase / 3-hydroxyacyl-[acyl-carrier-protein] dehydratase